MQCIAVDEIIDEIAAGAEAPAAAAEHIAQCERCTSALANARAIERALQVLPQPDVPAGFTPSVVTRIRRERWHSEQVLDWAFNIAVALGVLLIVGGLAGIAWATGLLPVGRDLVSVLSEGSPLILNRIASESQTIVLAGLLLTMALGLWWWVESDSVI
jgi:hypothetical protein